MRTFTLAQMETKVRERADALNAGNAPGQGEVWGYISSAYTDLYDILVRSGYGFGDTSTLIVGDGVNEEYLLPANYYATVGVEYQTDATSNSYGDPLPEAMPWEVPRYSRATPSLGGMSARAFRILGTGTSTRIALYPRPNAADVYRVRYAMAPTDLSAPMQMLDGISGWEELVVIEAAKRILQKEGMREAVADLKDDADRMRARIRENVSNRNLHQTHHVVDITGRAGSVFWTDEDQWSRWPR